MSVENASGIEPVEYNVVVEPRDLQTQTTGGVIMPDEVVEREGFARTEGVLLAKSDIAFSDLIDVPVGSRVMFNKYNATEAKGRDGRNYWIMKDKAIVAVVSE